MQFGQLQRREFIAGLGSATAWPIAPRAQQPEWTIGHNVRIDYRWAQRSLDYLIGAGLRELLR